MLKKKKKKTSVIRLLS